MKTSRASLSSGRGGFTLAEILVAMAVLSIVAVGLLQLLNFAVQTWQQGLVRMNCYIKARTVLDTAVADIQRGVFRSDLHNFPTPASYTSPSFTFYTRSAGISSGPGSVRPVSLVTYQLSANSGLPGYLLRSENSINWTSATSNVSFYQQLGPIPAAAVPTTPLPPSNLILPPNDFLCKGVAGFEVLFVLADGTTIPAKYYQSPTAFPVIMIGVAVAVIDDQAMTQLQTAAPSAFGNIQNTLETAVSSNFSTMSATAPFTSSNHGRSIKALWDPAMVPLYSTTGYPKVLATSFQTFERFVPCTPFY